VTAQPTSGTLVGPDDSGVFPYSPRANFYGSDAFSISATDNQGMSASATIALSIASVNDVPTAGDDSAMVAPGSALTIPVLPLRVGKNVASGSFDDLAYAILN
jgi:hypothetical protein